jgi:hypothetical protein
VRPCEPTPGDVYSVKTQRVANPANALHYPVWTVCACGLGGSLGPLVRDRPGGPWRHVPWPS